MTNIKNTPFGNSIEVSTEGVAPIWPGLGTPGRHRAARDLRGRRRAAERPDAMARSADRGYTVATALANRLVAQGVPFRAAHHAVGRLITELIDGGVTAPSGLDRHDLGARLDRILRAEGVGPR